MSETIIVGAINHHDWAVVAPWIISLRRSGFDGQVFLIAYEDVAASVLKEMRLRGVTIVESNMGISVNRDRFKDIPTILANFDPSTIVVTTDVRDIIFQTNPAHLGSLLNGGADLAVSSEGWTFRESEWNLATLRTVLPKEESLLVNETVFCSGVIVGRVGAMNLLSEYIWDLTKSAPSYNGDQIALNAVIRRPEFSGRVNRLDAADGTIFHARATWMRAALQHNAVALEPRFSLLRGLAVKANGEAVSILHQYTDRVSVRMRVLVRYGCVTISGTHQFRDALGLSKKKDEYWRQQGETKGNPNKKAGSEDYLIGAIDYHDWSDVCCWYRSAKRSGFKGKIVLICYEHITHQALRRIQSAGISIVAAVSRRGVNEDRFRDIANFSTALAPNDRILMTDVRDVVFQRSVHELLDELLAMRPLACASEGELYAESSWNMDNVKANFPDRLDEIERLEVFCAGVLAGQASRFGDFCRAIWNESIKAKSYNGDQVAMNIVMRSDAFRACMESLPGKNDLICHYGNISGTGNAHKRSHLTFHNGVLCRVQGREVGVFHQYTRDVKQRRSVLRSQGVLIEFYLGKFLSNLRRRIGLQSDWTPYWKA